MCYKTYNNMERWVGRTALITGASVGFGAAIAKRLVEHGMKVIGCARNVEKIEVSIIFLNSSKFKCMQAAGTCTMNQRFYSQQWKTAYAYRYTTKHCCTEYNGCRTVPIFDGIYCFSEICCFMSKILTD